MGSGEEEALDGEMAVDFLLLRLFEEAFKWPPFR